MKRYRFRLAQVERVRRIQEEQARAELLVARQRLIDAGADLSARVDRFDGRPVRSGATGASRFRAERTHEEMLAQAVTLARVAEANARLLVNRRVDEWTVAAREVSTLERLDARAREEHEAEAARDAQRELDDLVTSRWPLRPQEDRP